MFRGFGAAPLESIWGGGEKFHSIFSDPGIRRGESSRGHVYVDYIDSRGTFQLLSEVFLIAGIRTDEVRSGMFFLTFVRRSCGARSCCCGSNQDDSAATMTAISPDKSDPGDLCR